MKKEVFISNLKKNLSVLEEKEIQDIIEEYEQHIDMKMEKGLSEEDAIADFGDLKELSAGILEAYHVKADYKHEKKNLDFGKMKEESIKATGKATSALGKAGHGIGKVLKKAAHTIRTGFGAIGTWLASMFRSVKKMMRLPFDKMKNKTKHKEVNHYQKKTGESTFLSKLGALFFNICSFIGMFFVFCKNCIWNIFWVTIGAIATVGTLCVIFLFGLSMVLLFMGYPVIGIVIVIIGLGLIGSTVMIFSFSMIKKNKEKKESVTEEKQLELELMEVGQNAKKSKWLVGLFMTGILITGIGCGIAFAEYSSFEYGGEAILEGSEYFTRTIDYKFDLWPDWMNKAVIYLYIDEDYEFVKDANLDKDEVQFVVHYLSDDTSIAPEIHSFGANSEKYYYDNLYLDYNFNYHVDDLELLMRVKDQVLSDFKQRKISSYRNDEVEKVEIHMHPDALFEIEIK